MSLFPTVPAALLIGLLALLPTVKAASANPSEVVVTDAMRQEALKPTWVGNTDRLPSFPKPDPAAAFGDFGIKITQPDGSILRTPHDDWEGARQRIAQSPEWAKWIENKRTAVDAWIARHRDHVEWKAGWSHDFVHPEDGASLVWTQDIPGEDTDVFRTRDGRETGLTQKLKEAWYGEFRRKHAERMADAARLYRLHGDTAYLDWAAGQLDFYADNYEKWPLSWARKHPARLGIHCLDDALLLQTLVETARLIFDDVTPERRQAWHEKLFAPQVRMLNESYHVIHNIALWMRSAQAQVAMLYEDPELWEISVEAPYGLKDQLQRGVTSDYVWYEQSMSYNYWVVKAVLPTIIFAGLAGQGDRLYEEAAIVQNLMISPITMRFPDANRLPNPADAPDTPRVNFKVLNDAIRVLPTVPGIERSSLFTDWADLLDPPTEITSVQPLDLDPKKLSDILMPLDGPPVVSNNMESSRFALLKEGPWQVFFHYGQIFRSHTQVEALNWSASYKGTDITHDTGTTGYGAPIAYGYFSRGINHNLPLLSGEGQHGWNPGKLLRFEPDNAGSALMAAIQPSYRSGITAQRTLIIEGDTLIDEATLTRTAPGDPDSEWPAQRPDALPGLSLHVQGTPRLSDRFKPAPDLAKRSDAFSYWQDIRAARFTDQAEVIVDYPDGLSLRITFTVPGSFTLYQASTPDRPPQRRNGFYIELDQPLPVGGEVTFTTRFAPAE